MRDWIDDNSQPKLICPTKCSFKIGEKRLFSCEGTPQETHGHQISITKYRQGILERNNEAKKTEYFWQNKQLSKKGKMRKLATGK